MVKQGLAGFFGLSEGFRGRAADLKGASVLINRAPRSHEASASLKARCVGKRLKAIEQELRGGNLTALGNEP